MKFTVELNFFLDVQEKFQLRLKVLEEGLRSGNGTVRRPSVEAKRNPSVTSNGNVHKSSGAEEGAKVLANGSRTQRSAASQLRAMTGPILKNGRVTSKSFDGGRSDGRAFDAVPLPVLKPFTNGFEELRIGRKSVTTDVAVKAAPVRPEPKQVEMQVPESVKQAPEPVKQAEALDGAEPIAPTANATESVDDSVSGVLYDMLQKEVISLRKSSQEKDQSLKDKDNAIEVRLFVNSSRVSQE